jgi:hypothetical protein
LREQEDSALYINEISLNVNEANGNHVTLHQNIHREQKEIEQDRGQGLHESQIRDIIKEVIFAERIRSKMTMLAKASSSLPVRFKDNVN